jgi:hypothetical protein
MRAKVCIVALALVAAILSGCATRSAMTTQLGLTSTVTVTGAPGSVVVGHYLRHGKRIAFTNNLPFSVTETDLSEVEVRKLRREDAFAMTAQQGGSEVSSTAPPGLVGLKALLLLDKGLTIRVLTD